MRPDAYDMMLMGALGGAILAAVPAFALGWWFKRWRDRRNMAPFIKACVRYAREIKKMPTFRVGGSIAGQRTENELPQSQDRHISIPYPAPQQEENE